MNQRDSIRIVWSRSDVAADQVSGKGPEPQDATPRPLPRSRRLWGREDGFTMSAARR